ncbi:MAG: FecR family protein [Methylovulum sp.]|nr:FecR family protein [Methylovulum sp.]
MKQTNESQPSQSELEELIDEQAVAWFARLRASDVSREEKATFADWLRQTPAHQQAFDEICLLWGDTQLKQALGEAEKKTSTKKGWAGHCRFQLPLLMAACLALVFVFRTDIAVLFQADYATGIGKQQTVRLEDGSYVMLNTNSAIKVAMGDKQRTVELLRGEAFFDVKPDAHRPFIVYGDHSTTRVLGTRFFVYEKHNSDEVKVLSGNVRVSNAERTEESVLLHDRDGVSVNRAGFSKTNRLDTKLTTSWIDGYLVFQDMALADVIEQIQRYRNGVVIFRDGSLRQFKINGRINLHDPAHILETLENTLAVKFTHLTDWLVIIG